MFPPSLALWVQCDINTETVYCFIDWLGCSHFRAEYMHHDCPLLVETQLLQEKSAIGYWWSYQSAHRLYNLHSWSFRTMKEIIKVALVRVRLPSARPRPLQLCFNDRCEESQILLSIFQTRHNFLCWNPTPSILPPGTLQCHSSCCSPLWDHPEHHNVIPFGGVAVCAM